MKKLLIFSFVLCAITIQAREYTFINKRDNPLEVKIQLKDGSMIATGPSTIAKKGRATVQVPAESFVEKFIITEFQGDGWVIPETWYSRQTGKGENIAEDFIKYYGHDELLNRGGQYTIAKGMIEVQ